MFPTDLGVTVPASIESAIEIFQTDKQMRAEFVSEYKRMYQRLLPWNEIDVPQLRLFNVMTEYTETFGAQSEVKQWFTRVTDARSPVRIRPTLRDSAPQPAFRYNELEQAYELWTDPGAHPSALESRLVNYCEGLLWNERLLPPEAIERWFAISLFPFFVDMTNLLVYWSYAAPMKAARTYNVYAGTEHFYTRERLLVAIALRNIPIRYGMFHQIPHARDCGVTLNILSVLEPALRMGLAYLFVTPSSKFEKKNFDLGISIRTDEHRIVYYGFNSAAYETRDKQNRFHNWNGPVYVRHGSVNVEVFALLNTVVDSSIIKEPDSFDLEALLSVENAAIRSLILKRLPPDTLVQRFKGQVLDRSKEDSCWLIKIETERASEFSTLPTVTDHVFLHMFCHSSDRQYLLEVPPTMRTSARKRWRGRLDWSRRPTTSWRCKHRG